MKYFEIDINNLTIPNIKRPIALCLGNFDGVHLGHQKLINEAVENSELDVAVMTFSEPLGKFAFKKKNRRVLTSVDDRRILFSKMRVDICFVLKLTKELADLSPEEFINKILTQLNVKEIYVGSDYRFGKDAKGMPFMLKKYFDVHLVPLLKIDGIKVSTKYIIKLIETGQIEFANKYLGYQYQLRGKIGKGQQLGTQMGYPTANLITEVPYVLPLYGVYNTIVYISGIPHVAITNVGVRPTVSNTKKPSIESHILFYHESKDYDKTIYVTFISFVRPEKKFSTVEELQKQLFADVYFAVNRYVTKIDL
jgi:riboflavin kinase/FMN adenylyltransferase